MSLQTNDPVVPYFRTDVFLQTVSPQFIDIPATNWKWKKGDVIIINLPMHTWLSPMPNVPEYASIMHGPILLAAKTGEEDLNGLIAGDSRWGHIASGKKLPVDQAPIIIEDNKENLANKLMPISGQPMNFSFASTKIINAEKLVLQPFYKVHDARYMMYWMTLSNSAYKSYLDSLAGIEKQKLALQARTVDFVAPGEQQPEVDHAMLKENSKTGSFNDEFWRDASNQGFFSYLMSTQGKTKLSLNVKYWGAEWGNRKFDIYIDDEKLLTVDNTQKWNQSNFQNEEYQIPEKMLTGKKAIRVKFQALPNNTAGAIYYIRLTEL